MDELRYSQHVGPLNIRFSMESVIVDGIQSHRPYYLYDNPMFTLKSETNELDEPTDTGQQWNWQPHYEVSESHWLSCGMVIPLNSLCSVCGIRGERRRDR